MSWEGPEGITLTGGPGCLPWPEPPALLTFCMSGWDKRNQSMWSPDCGEVVLRHRLSCWLILTRDSGQALPHIVQGEPKYPCRDLEHSWSGELHNSLLEAGQGHRGWARAFRPCPSMSRTKLGYASTCLQGERHHISPAHLAIFLIPRPLFILVRLRRRPGGRGIDGQTQQEAGDPQVWREPGVPHSWRQIGRTHV